MAASGRTDRTERIESKLRSGHRRGSFQEQDLWFTAPHLVATLLRIGQLSFDSWSAVIGTHLTGFFLCASAAMPRMIKQARGGAIVSIASTAAFVGLPGRGPYTAAKAGLVGLTRSLAVEAAPHRIRVNAVAPGFTRTAIIEDAVANGSLQEEWMLERVPMRRLAEPAEIASVVRFLASDAAAYVTGQTIVADGGWTIQGINKSPDWLQPTADSRI